MNSMLRRALRTYRGLLNQLEVNLLGDDGQIWWDELRKFMRKEPCWVKAKSTAKRIHTIAATIMEAIVTDIKVNAVPACKVKECFTDRSVFAYRDGDLEGWLTSEVPEVSAGLATNFKLVKNGMTFKEMAQAVLGESTDDIGELGRLLIQRGKTFSPKQVEDLSTRFIKGDKTLKLLDNGWANLFFVHDKNSVFVLCVRLRSDGWHVDVGRLDDGRRWGAGDQLFVRN